MTERCIKTKLWIHFYNYLQWRLKLCSPNLSAPNMQSNSQLMWWCIILNFLNFIHRSIKLRLFVLSMKISFFFTLQLKKRLFLALQLKHSFFLTLKLKCSFFLTSQLKRSFFSDLAAQMQLFFWPFSSNAAFFLTLQLKKLTF